MLPYVTGLVLVFLARRARAYVTLDYSTSTFMEPEVPAPALGHPPASILNPPLLTFVCMERAGLHLGAARGDVTRSAVYGAAL